MKGLKSKCIGDNIFHQDVEIVCGEYNFVRTLQKSSILKHVDHIHFCGDSNRNGTCLVMCGLPLKSVFLLSSLSIMPA